MLLTLTKLYEVVWTLGPVYIMTMLLTELSVKSVKKGEGEAGGVGGLTQGQVTDTLLNHIAGGRRADTGHSKLAAMPQNLVCMSTCLCMWHTRLLTCC